MQSYSVLAKYYDRLTHNDCDYDRWSQYLFGELKKSNLKCGVDLACGTGKMTERLAAYGFDVIGVDGSAEMLREASHKSRTKYVLQDMRELELPRPVDFIVAVNDGVNYVSFAELPSFFERISFCLKAGGLFVFDISSFYKLKEILADNVFFTDEQDFTLLWTNSFSQSKRIVRMDLTLFEKREDGSYLRRDESHIQYAHTSEDIVNSLIRAGFKNISLNESYGKKQADAFSERLTFTAEKGE